MKYFIEVRDFLYYNRKKLLIVIGTISLVCFFLLFNNKDDSLEEINSQEFLNEIKSIDNEVSTTKIIVDIKGQIKNPGTYEVTNDMRIIDVINMAEGLLENSDTSKINLSQKVYDEMVIYVPSLNDSQEEDINENMFSNNDNINNNNNMNNLEYSQISINSGGIKELMTIKGIGESKARTIIEYRNKNGNFKSIEEIKNVKGIGNSTFEKIKNYIKL